MVSDAHSVMPQRLEIVRGQARVIFEASGEREECRVEPASVAAGRHVAQFVQRALQPRRIATGNADQLEARVSLEERGMVQAALAQTDDENAVASHNWTFRQTPGRTTNAK